MERRAAGESSWGQVLVVAVLPRSLCRIQRDHKTIVTNFEMPHDSAFFYVLGFSSRINMPWVTHGFLSQFFHKLSRWPWAGLASAHAIRDTEQIPGNTRLVHGETKTSGY